MLAKEAPKTEQPKEVTQEVSRIVMNQMPEVDRGLYEMMELYGKECTDPDNIEKMKFIAESLGSNAKDTLLHIFSEIGQTPQGETKLGRVFKYLRLRQSADKALKQYENIKKDMNFLRSNQWG